MLKTHLRLTVLSIGLLSSFLCAPAMAQSSPDSKPIWVVGLGVTEVVSPYRSYNNKIFPLPMVSYSGKSFFIEGWTLGYHLFKTEKSSFSIVVSPWGEDFTHTDTKDPHLRHLSDRSFSGVGGIAWRYNSDWGTLKASARKEFTGHGGGSLFDISYSYTLTEGAFRITPELGVGYSSSALNNYYYGISAAEAARSGLSVYHPRGGALPYLGVVANYQLSSSWTMFGGVRYTALPSTVKDSPMVDSSHAQSYFIGMSYKF